MTAVLLCHTPEDDEAESGAITRFRAVLEERARFVTGRPELEIVTDRTWVSWSTHWRRALDGTPDECALLIAVVTPRWLADPRCRQEWERFRRREQTEGRIDLVLGVSWYPADQIAAAADAPRPRPTTWRPTWPSGRWWLGTTYATSLRAARRSRPASTSWPSGSRPWWAPSPRCAR